MTSGPSGTSEAALSTSATGHGRADGAAGRGDAGHGRDAGAAPQRSFAPGRVNKLPPLLGGAAAHFGEGEFPELPRVELPRAVKDGLEETNKLRNRSDELQLL